MSGLSETFMKCCFTILQTKNNEEVREKQMAKVIDTLDLSPSNLAVALIYLSKYQSNSVNNLDNNEGDTLHFYIIISSLIIANKFINDLSYTLKTWQSILRKCSNFEPSLSMLNQLELNFLAALDFGLNTKHDPRLWALFHNLNSAHISQLHMAVDDSSSCIPLTTVPTEATVPTNCYGLATPPLAFTIHASPLSYAGTPTPGAPFTPVSLSSGISGVVPVALQFLQIYPLPALQQTPQRMMKERDGWQQSAKRRKLGCGACGMGFAFEPVYNTACFNL